MRPTILNRLCLLFAFGGIFIAAYLSFSHLKNLDIPCGAGSDGCNQVNYSQYGNLWGIPTSLFGLLAYLSLAFLGILRTIKKDGPAQMFARYAGLTISGVGTIISFLLIYASLFVIHATCIWCMASAALMTLSFLFHAILAQSNDPIEPGPFDNIWIGILAVCSIGALGLRFMDLKTAGARSRDWPEHVIESGQFKTEDFAPDTVPAMGASNGQIIVVEFGDFVCPHCKDSYQLMKAFLQKANGKVTFAFRHAPLIHLPGHGESVRAAMFSEYAQSAGKFWQFLDAVFSMEDNTQLSDNDLYTFSKSIGLSPRDIEKKLKTGKGQEYTRFEADSDMMSKLGISATPTFVAGFRGQKPRAYSETEIEEWLQSPPVQAVIKGAQ